MKIAEFFLKSFKTARSLAFGNLIEINPIFVSEEIRALFLLILFTL